MDMSNSKALRALYEAGLISIDQGTATDGGPPVAVITVEIPQGHSSNARQEMRRLTRQKLFEEHAELAEKHANTLHAPFRTWALAELQGLRNRFEITEGLEAALLKLLAARG